ncbi:creatininase family protein [Sporosalibacterium faouarense]|uniref:creatininase family protein n=1 Tax=Sporosalibacterium faouarense TaxID=516123 RepID=UPI00192C13DA|nr:creatininase family protein [Sporosalibacterium faouarense]
MYMKYMNMDTFKEKTSTVDTVIIPIGMIEAHGHHCPLGTDILIPNKFCEIIEDKIGDKVIIAPEINYGHSWALSVYPGTINVSTEAFTNYVKEVALGFVANGFKNIILLNGHGGNISALRPISEAIADNNSVAVVFNWWVDFRDEILKITEGQGHAGEDETSAVLAIDESIVDMSKATSNEIKIKGSIYFKDFGKIIYKDALSGDATKASKEKGEEIYKSVSKRIIEIISDVQKGEYC